MPAALFRGQPAPRHPPEYGEGVSETDFAQRPNLTIMTGCHVERLLHRYQRTGTVCRGVQFTGGGTGLQRADNGNPAGGRRDRLAPHPATIRHRRGGHAAATMASRPSSTARRRRKSAGPLQLRMVYKVAGRQNLEYERVYWFGKMKIGLEYAMLQSGPMSMAPSQLGAFARSEPEQATPNLQYHVQPLSLEKFGDPLHAFPAFTASVCNLRPTARGHVRLSRHDSATRRRRFRPTI
jgi:choline dehydrogenase